MTKRTRPGSSQALRTGLLWSIAGAIAATTCTAMAQADDPTANKNEKGASVAPAQSLPESCPFSEEDLAFAKECFQEAKAMSDAEGGKLWGKKLYGPFMFVDPNTRGIIANGPDKEGKLVSHNGVWIGHLPESENVAFTAYKWGGVHWTMIGWPPQKIPFARKRLHAHEMFHRIQKDVGLAPREADNSHLDTKDGRIWLRAEWRALRKALITKDQERRKAIEDALVFRQYRRSLFPDRADDECAFEMHEGVAEYTGFAGSGMKRAVALFQAGIQLDFFDTRPAFVLTFAYGSGPAYGLLLDEKTETWRKGTSPETDMGVLLAKAYDISLPKDLKTEAKERFKAYKGQEIITEESQRAEERVKKLAEYQQRFTDGPTLTLSAAGRINWAYDPRNVTTFGDNGRVYETGRVTDNWGILSVEKNGMLLISSKSGTVERAIVPAPSDTKANPIVGDGYTLTLAEGWELKPGKRRGDYYVAPIEKAD